jgi:hypothetical protein
LLTVCGVADSCYDFITILVLAEVLVRSSTVPMT